MVFTLGFKKEDNPVAYNLYQGLLGEGVFPSQVDSGYVVANLDGVQCPTPDEQSCSVGADNYIIEAEEVFDYSLNRYERFHKLLGGVLGYPLPWAINEYNRDTNFDAQIRKKVKSAISSLDDILTNKGFKRRTSSYRERLALGLFWFALFPKVGSNQFSDMLDVNAVKTELKAVGLGKFFQYLKINGGLGLVDVGEGGDVSELTALEMLKNKAGKCTEMAKVLFAVFRAARLDPQFVMVKLSKPDAETIEGTGSLKKKAKGVIGKISEANPDFNHVCIGLSVKSGLRLFDLGFFQSSAKYATYQPLTPRQYLSWDTVNKSRIYYKYKAKDYGKAEELNRDAIAIDPLNAAAYKNLGNIFFQRNSLNDAISFYTKALTIYPSFSQVYLNRGTAYLLNGNVEQAITDFGKFLNYYPQGGEKVYDILYTYTLKTLKDNDQIDKLSNGMLLDVAKDEAHFINACILWMAGYKDKARKKLKGILEMDVESEAFVSSFNAPYRFEKILKLMPQDMRNDEEVKKIVSDIEKLFKGSK